jgi:hypothetical protein
MPKHLFSTVVAVASVVLVSAAGLGQSGPTASEFLKMVDTDNDKTISIPEIDAFAVKKFDQLKMPGGRTRFRWTTFAAEFLRRISTRRIRLAETQFRY